MQKILTSQLEASKIGDLTNAKVNIIEFTSRNDPAALRMKVTL